MYDTPWYWADLVIAAIIGAVGVYVAMAAGEWYWAVTSAYLLLLGWSLYRARSAADTWKARAEELDGDADA